MDRIPVYYVKEYDLLSCRDGTIDQEHRTIFGLDWLPNHPKLNDLVHGLSWIGLAAQITPWLCTTVSNLPAMLDARLWRDGTADCDFGLDTALDFGKNVM
ncbi:hypothetical protein TIFTF001_008158 [Ficus carica]|uniref:Uncharacterized protein n=1 Tax=Ficus carica TaxID=3494 RepID=A0AA88D2L8_FICCA|nr:hypothetical protein TIFTF001_008158 [Ficus carica]